MEKLVNTTKSCLPKGIEAICMNASRYVFPSTSTKKLPFDCSKSAKSVTDSICCICNRSPFISLVIGPEKQRKGIGYQPNLQIKIL